MRLLQQVLNIILIYQKKQKLQQVLTLLIIAMGQVKSLIWV